MMEENFLRSPRIIRNSISTTLSISLPISRYIIGDYTALRSVSEDDGDDVGRVDEAYSKPLLVIDVIWNLAFVLVSSTVLVSTLEEKPSTPLRVWIGGYALQCLLHVCSVYYEHLRRIKREIHGGYRGFSSSEGCISIAKKLEAANTMASSFWWVLGFYWIVGGGPSLIQDSPNLYWLAVVYLALDIFFMIFCIGVAFIICVVLFCCIPVAAIAYAMTIKEGASEDDIKILPKFRFHHSHALRKSASEFNYCGTDRSSPLAESSLYPEDSECCICLTYYVEGVELCTLPCNHHFHYSCISKWLRINATCPLCKFNILKGDQSV